MKRKSHFIIFFLFLFVLQHIFSFFLDKFFLGTEIYKSAIITSKAEMLRQSEYIILGGSNGLVSFDNNLLEKSLNAKVYNLSEDDTNLKLHFLQLKMLLNRRIIPKGIFLVIGTMEDGLSRNALRYLPYISHDNSVNEYFMNADVQNYFLYKLFPIFKWAKYNNDLIFPLFYAIFISKSYHHRFDKNGEYTYPNHGLNLISQKKRYQVSIIKKYNSDLKNFEKLCQVNNIKLYVINTPFLNKKIVWDNPKSNFYNFSSISGFAENYFYDETHINKTGKSIFTKLFIDSLIKKDLSQ